MKSDLDHIIETDAENVYRPSPERIRRFCAVYQRKWSDKEHQRRSGQHRFIRWLIPEVSLPDYDDKQMSE